MSVEYDLPFPSPPRTGGWRALAFAVTLVLVACGDRSPTSASRTSGNRPPTAVGDISGFEITAGDSVAVTLERFFRDPDATALTYTAATSDDGVVATSVRGSELTVAAAGPGVATVIVTATDPGGLTARQSFGVTVPNRAPEVRAVPSLELASGTSATMDLAKYLRDPDGEALAYTATTADETVVSVVIAGAGLTVTGVARGETTVTVLGIDSGGLSVSKSFLVTVDGVSIQDVEPAVLFEGQEATVRGSGFSDSVQNNLVLIDGILAPVTGASATSLSILVPRGDCLPPRRAELRITVMGLSDALPVAVTPRSSEDIDLESGWYRYTYAGDGCLHLPADAAGAEWLIGVTSTAEGPASLTPVTLTGVPGSLSVFAAAQASAVVRAPAAPESLREGIAFAGSVPGDFPALPLGGQAGQRSGTGPELFGPRRNWERHNEIMANSEALLRRFGPPSAAAAAAPAQRQADAAGDTVTLFAGGQTDCTERDTVRAVVRMIGDHTVWLEDIDNPAGGFTESELAELDAFYSSHVKAVHDEYFGQLSDIDENDRITILMTKEVNRDDLGGRVWAGDLYPSSHCSTSNEAEIFFGRVPDPEGVFGRDWTRQETLDYYPSLLTHEIAHLVQMAYRIFSEAGWKTTWETEGGATLSEQLVAYKFFGHESIQDRGYASYEIGRAWYSEWASGMATFFGWDRSTASRRVSGAPEQCSWTGRPSEGNDGPCRSVRAAYDVPSMLLRYAMDRWGGDYPGGEKALIRRLTQSPQTGYASLEDVSSWPIEKILANFYMSLWMDLNDADWFSSWDFADIWRHFDEETWLRPYASTAPDYQYDWRIRAGSSAFVRWSPEGTMAPTSLKVTSPGGGRVPGHISVWALRIR